MRFFCSLSFFIIQHTFFAFNFPLPFFRLLAIFSQCLNEPAITQFLFVSFLRKFCSWVRHSKCFEKSLTFFSEISTQAIRSHLHRKKHEWMGRGCAMYQFGGSTWEFQKHFNVHPKKWVEIGCLDRCQYFLFMRWRERKKKKVKKAEFSSFHFHFCQTNCAFWTCATYLVDDILRAIKL